MALNLPVYYMDSGVALLATGIYTVTRSNAPTYSNGVEVDDPSPTTFSVEAIVNPLSGIELKRLPENRRVDDFREIYVSVALNTASDVQAADQISIDGATFEVERSERWNLMGNMWRCIAQRSGRLNPT